MDMIHAKLRHIIESNSSEEGVGSCSSVAGDEIHDSGVPGSFSWFRSEGATSLDALHCVGCESLLVPQGVQELPYRWVLAGYQRLHHYTRGKLSYPKAIHPLLNRSQRYTPCFYRKIYSKRHSITRVYRPGVNCPTQ